MHAAFHQKRNQHGDTLIVKPAADTIFYIYQAFPHAPPRNERNTLTIMKQLGTHLFAALATLFALTTLLSSCDSVIYDDEGDCSVSYRLHFKYDYNMKFADAFAHEVKAVHVYAFNEDSVLVWEQTEESSALAADDYAMTLSLPAGKYHLIAWCSGDNTAAGTTATKAISSRQHSFTTPDLTVGTSRMTDLTCRLNRKTSTADAETEGKAYVDEDLTSLYHGQLTVELPTNADGGTYDYTMSLTKDTNHLRVILQHLSGKAVDVSQFTFTLEDENGLMNYDNALLPDDSITYRTWNTESGEAGVESSDGTQTSVGVAIADLTTARLIDGHKMYLTIRNAKGDVVVRVPFIDYALLVKGYYNHAMSNQEYLDRQDEYSMTFFLDESDNWLSASVLINAWRVVFSNHELH